MLVASTGFSARGGCAFGAEPYTCYFCRITIYAPNGIRTRVLALKGPCPDRARR